MCLPCPPQGEALLGLSAGKLAEVKERDSDAVAAVLKAAQWQVCGLGGGGKPCSRPHSGRWVEGEREGGRGVFEWSGGCSSAPV